MFSEIIISVSDVDAAVEFYSKACHFKYVRTVVHDGAKVAELDAAGQRVTLVVGDRPGVQLVMETSNIRADHRRVKRLKVSSAEQPVAVVGGEWLPFSDPSGNALAYWKPADDQKS